jgi:hypothetical protein
MDHVSPGSLTDAQLRELHEASENGATYRYITEHFNLGSGHFAKQALQRAKAFIGSEASKIKSKEAGLPETVVEWLRLGAEAAERGEVYGVNADVTPEIAAALLSLNTNNRNINEKGVQYFEEAVRKSRFHLMGSGPVISKTGVLNDGQHKLTAVVNAGISVKMFLHFGEQDTARSVHDSGGAGKRTASQAISIEYKGAIPHAKVSATVARLVMSGQLGDQPNMRKIAHDEYVMFVGIANPMLSQSALEGQKLYRTTKAAEGPCAAAHYFIRTEGREGRRDPDRLAEFWDKVILPANLNSGDPRFVLHDWLLAKEYNQIAGRSGMHRSQTAARVLMGTIVRGWNKFIRGEPVKKVAWVHTTPFPRPL